MTETLLLDQFPIKESHSLFIMTKTLLLAQFPIKESHSLFTMTEMLLLDQFPIKESHSHIGVFGIPVTGGVGAEGAIQCPKLHSNPDLPENADWGGAFLHTKHDIVSRAPRLAGERD